MSIIYRAPSYSTYSQETNSYVYGDGDSSIESRDYVLISKRPLNPMSIF
ncbi:hypothetical protein [Acinetobacter sp.]|nr:hypothetical protein [Acinetobacter sp.]